MSLRASLYTLALTLSAIDLADAQSLADVARAENGRRATTPPASKVLDNSTLSADPISTSPASEVATRFDRIGNYTSVEVRDLDLGGLELHAYYSYPGGYATTPVSVALHFSRSSDSWNYLTYRPLTLLLDGTTRLSLGKASHDGSVGRGYVLEQMTVRVSTSQFLQIANAKQAEGRLGTTDFVIGPRQLAALRALAQRMDPKRGPGN